MSFERWRATGREAAVLGLARSGLAAALLLRREGVPVYASDLARDLGPGADGVVSTPEARLREAGVDFQLGGHDLGRIARAGVCVVSPGVPPEAPPVRAARDAGVPVISEVDVGYAALPGARYAVITGTNGKTTTTALTGHLLQAAGCDAVTAGNIGTPLADLALRGVRPAWVALELSSFQLHDTHDLVPTIGAITNLAPDHLDRYSTLEAYYADKDLLYRHAMPESVWVTNGDDAEVQRRAAGRAGTHLRWSLRSRADGWYDAAGRRLMLADHAVLPREALPLLGDHNVANALCALLVAVRAGGDLDRLAEGLRSFRALPHRMEPVREVRGVLWINDSKATNVASTAVAVQALERPFVLLLGGRHKGEPYTALAALAGGRCRGVVAYGESRGLVTADLGGRLPVVDAGTDFGEVIAAAGKLARPGDAVLLSPACSSYDMFQNYQDRGAQFRAAVESL
jgi:UDP-N-acetylmuramoylalanine--D-glutamate ligase